MKQFKFEYPSCGTSEERMFTDVTAVLDEVGIYDELRHKILLTVSEAFSNALIHGNKMDSKKRVLIELAINEEELVADIIDEGSGGLAKLNRRSAPELLAENGRGIDFMQRYANRTEFSETSTGGLRVTIRFQLSTMKV